eukprot:Hpha_TRINITY_DN15410_c3_g4::TRINITY_DN15410_c3_g4_i2::g.173561::m.173561
MGGTEGDLAVINAEVCGVGGVCATMAGVDKAPAATTAVSSGDEYGRSAGEMEGDIEVGGTLAWRRGLGAAPDTGTSRGDSSPPHRSSLSESESAPPGIGIGVVGDLPGILHSLLCPPRST